MTLTLPALANTFYWLAAALGFPSIAGLLLYTVYQGYRMMAPAPAAFPVVKNPDGVILILGGIAGVIQAISRFVGFLGKYVVVGVAIASAAGLVLAFSFWLTGRGLHAHQTWARSAAFVMVSVLFLMCLLTLSAARGLPQLLIAAIGTGCVVALMTLWRWLPA